MKKPILLQDLGQEDSAGMNALMTSRVICILKNAQVLRGDGAGAFIIYAVHTCHPWEGLEVGQFEFC